MAQSTNSELTDIIVKSKVLHIFPKVKSKVLHIFLDKVSIILAGIMSYCNILFYIFLLHTLPKGKPLLYSGGLCLLFQNVHYITNL